MEGKVITRIWQGFGGLRASKLVGFAVLSVLMVSAGTLGRAQVSTASLNGTVQDNTGAVIPEAKVAVIQTQTGFGVPGSARDPRIASVLTEASVLIGGKRQPWAGYALWRSGSYAKRHGTDSTPTDTR